MPESSDDLREYNYLEVGGYENASHADWEGIFKNETWFKGDPVRAADLMMEFVRGMKWVKKDQESKDEKFDLPPLGVVKDYGGEEAPGLAVHVNGLVFVDGKYLEETCAFPRGSFLESIGKEGQVLFKGTPEENYFLAGIEEADHARFHEEHPENQNDERPHFNDVPSIVYQAQQHEYEATQKQLKAAEEVNMNPIMIMVLKHRLKTVELFRAKSKK